MFNMFYQCLTSYQPLHAWLPWLPLPQQVGDDESMLDTSGRICAMSWHLLHARMLTQPSLEALFWGDSDFQFTK